MVSAARTMPGAANATARVATPPLSAIRRTISPKPRVTTARKSSRSRIDKSATSAPAAIPVSAAIGIASPTGQPALVVSRPLV